MIDLKSRREQLTKGLDTSNKSSSHREDIVEASKAIFDLTKDLMEQHFKKLEQELTSKYEKALGTEIDSQIKYLIDGKLKDLEYNAPIPIEKMLDKSVEQKIDKHLSAMRTFYEKTLIHHLKALSPQVTVTVPENAIKIHQEKSIVNVHVPQQKSMTKHIRYDEAGRPIEIKELEDKEKETT